MDSISAYIDKHKKRFLAELFDLLRIPSVSADPASGGAMITAAEFVKSAILKSGADRAQVMNTAGWPVVYAEKIMDTSLPTVMVYGHYDVQPPDPLREWLSKPFDPEIRDGKIYARGADDDKGQLFMQLKAFEYMVAEHKLPCNIRFLIEGEEEIGSPSLEQFCKDNKELLTSDLILVSDTTMRSLEIPTLTTGLRGLAYFELCVNGPNRDLHSGLYGGAVKNPANALAELIAGFKDDLGRITLQGFYDDVEDVAVAERKLLNEVPLSEQQFMAGIAIGDLFGESGYTTIERLGMRPSLDVNGIWGGYTGEGAKTVLPSKSSAKISMRLVPHQDPVKVEEQLRRHIDANLPPGVNYILKPMHGGFAYVSPWNSDGVQAAVKAIEKTFGKKPLPVRSGGSIPVIAVFEKILKIKTVLMGFGLESDAIHSPNENFPLVNFYKGIETIPWFYHYYNQVGS
jgi:acetylornithine deacetylase/succinyl-diaminopimelate desuccinylase-like protein